MFPILQSLFIKVADLQCATLLKKDTDIDVFLQIFQNF